MILSLPRPKTTPRRPRPAGAYVVRFPEPARPLKTIIIDPGRPGDPAIVVRHWTPADAAACRLCRSGCNAEIGAGEIAACLVYAPAGPRPTPEQAAEIRLDRPFQHAPPRSPARWAKAVPPG